MNRLIEIASPFRLTMATCRTTPGSHLRAGFLQHSPDGSIRVAMPGDEFRDSGASLILTSEPGLLLEAWWLAADDNAVVAKQIEHGVSGNAKLDGQCLRRLTSTVAADDLVTGFGAQSTRNGVGAMNGGG